MVEARALHVSKHLEPTVRVESPLVENFGPARMAKPAKVVGRWFRVAGTDDALEALQRDPAAAVQQVLRQVDDAVAARSDRGDDAIASCDDSADARSRAHA